MPAFKRLCFLALAILPAAAYAQAPAPPAQPQWESMPRMELERFYAGPLRDTMVQRWRDPVDGTLCYLYIPITAQHSPPSATGYVLYGANTIGSISCVPGSKATAPAAQPSASRTLPKGAPKRPGGEE